jgi:hypothetical protein
MSNVGQVNILKADFPHATAASTVNKDVCAYKGFVFSGLP